MVNEILTTEKTYVSQLNLMVTMFVDKPDSDKPDPEKHTCGLTLDQILQIFANFC